VTDEFAARLRERFDDVVEARGERTVFVARDRLLDTLAWLRDDAGVDFLSSITVTHWPGGDPGFWISYDLRTVARPVRRVRVKVGLPESDGRVPSVTSLFPTANWHEREQWDLFGVVFDGHPDLTRILLPDDWEGHPLRKDEELGGVNTWYHGAFIPPVDKRTMA
jgi:NADH-quinone oxidoreductase subunit C